MDQERVSVIIPFYNASKYLTECLNTVIGQTYRNLEIICVDDGSTDESCSVVKDFEKKDDRIKLLSLCHQNAGAARNYGFERASGSYVIFLDADDYFDLELIEKMLKQAVVNAADVTVCQSIGLDDKTNTKHALDGGLDLSLVPEQDYFSGAQIPDRIFQLTAGWAWDKLYRTDFLRKNKIRFQEIQVANDELFTDISLATAGRISVVKEVLITHRTRVSGSIEATRSKHWRCGFDMLSAEKDELCARNLFCKYERSYINRAAKYTVWNACSITEKNHFFDYYKWFQENGEKEYGFLEYDKEVYEDEFFYDIINNMNKLSAEEFLCERVFSLNEVVLQRDNQIEEMKEEMNAYINRVNEYVYFLSKQVSEKSWKLPKEVKDEKLKIIIYGYGDMGHDYIAEIQDTHSAEVVMVVDRKYDQYENQDVYVYPIEKIKDVEYDYILIAVYDKKIVEDISESLIEMGVSKYKLLWRQGMLNKE